MILFKKRILIFFIFLFAFNKGFPNGFDQDFSGHWCWDKDSIYSAFSIELQKKGNFYRGSYSGVAQKGILIDENDDAFSFKASKNNLIKTIITAGRTGNKGIIQLKILGEKELEWRVLLYPADEMYVPVRAILYQCQ